MGKSTLLYQVIEQVLRVDDNVLYVNFEDEVLKKYPLNEIVEAYSTIAPVRMLFLDEIQNCKDWVSFVRKAYDRKEIAQSWVSGSNSSFIKKEFATVPKNVFKRIYFIALSEGLLG